MKLCLSVKIKTKTKDISHENSSSADILSEIPNDTHRESESFSEIPSVERIKQ